MCFVPHSFWCIVPPVVDSLGKSGTQQKRREGEPGAWKENRVNPKAGGGKWQGLVLKVILTVLLGARFRGSFPSDAKDAGKHVMPVC